MAGLAITSEIPLPSCMPLDAAPVPADVFITLGPATGPSTPIGSCGISTGSAVWRPSTAVG
jgi:hypothetical protein